MLFNRKQWRVPLDEEPTELDKKVMAFEKMGCLVPKRTLIKTKEQIEGIRRSGVVNTGVSCVAETVISEVRAVSRICALIASGSPAS